MAIGKTMMEQFGDFEELLSAVDSREQIISAWVKMKYL